jgi:putative transcriptional regulator
MGNKVKAARVLKGIKQKDIADKLGISVNAYSLKENNKQNFSLEQAKIVSNMLDTTIDELFFGDTEEVVKK